MNDFHSFAVAHGQCYEVKLRILCGMFCKGYSLQGTRGRIMTQERCFGAPEALDESSSVQLLRFLCGESQRHGVKSQVSYSGRCCGKGCWRARLEAAGPGVHGSELGQGTLAGLRLGGSSLPELHIQAPGSPQQPHTYCFLGPSSGFANLPKSEGVPHQGIFLS